MGPGKIEVSGARGERNLAGAAGRGRQQAGAAQAVRQAKVRVTAEAIEVRMTAEATEMRKAVAALGSVIPRLASHGETRDRPGQEKRLGSDRVAPRVGFQRVHEFGLGRSSAVGLPGEKALTPRGFSLPKWEPRMVAVGF